MTSKEIKKLSRAEMMELLVAQSKENDQLKEALEQANQKLEEKERELSRMDAVVAATVAIYDTLQSYQSAVEKLLADDKRAERVPEAPAKPD